MTVLDTIDNKKALTLYDIESLGFVCGGLGGIHIK